MQAEERVLLLWRRRHLLCLQLSLVFLFTLNRIRRLGSYIPHIHRCWRLLLLLLYVSAARLPIAWLNTLTLPSARRPLRPHVDLFEALHWLIQLASAIYHVFKLVHTVSKHYHLAAYWRIPQMFESLLLEIGQVVFVVLLQEFNDQVLAIQFKLLFEGAFEVWVLIHDGASLSLDVVVIDNDLAERRLLSSSAQLWLMQKSRCVSVDTVALPHLVL